MSQSWQPPEPAWRPAAPRGRSARRVAVALIAAAVGVFAIAAFGVGFLLAGSDDPGGSPTPGTDGPATPITPHPDTVAATLGEPVTVTGSNEAVGGRESATVELTLTGPEVSTEAERDGYVYVVFQGIIEVIDGVYDFNTLHLHLVPAADVPEWREGDDATTPEPVPGFEPSLKSTRLSAGDRISGSIVFEVSESTVDGAAVVLRSWLLPDGPAAAYWPLG